MKTLLLAAAVTAALATPAFADALGCNMRDNHGNNLVYLFSGNTRNGDGSFGGTMVESGFDKNGTSVISQAGHRPIWIYGGNQGGGFNLYSRSAPGWSIRWVSNGGAVLVHNNTIVGNGNCQPVGGGLGTEASVGDQGY